MASPNGIIKVHKIKEEFKRTRQERVAESSGIRPFYVLLYHHTNATRKLAAYAVDDAASYYGKVRAPTRILKYTIGQASRLGDKYIALQS